MKFLFKFRAVSSNSNIFPIHVTNLRSFSFSIITRPSRNPDRKSTEEARMKNGKEKKDFADLFNEITQIIGTHNFNVDGNGSNKFPAADVVVSRESLDCAEPVCENANVNQELEISIEVSPIVHKVTEVLRGGETEVSIEERLENSGIEFDSDIVDKVLKRCFKVPDLALRFFNWIKLKNGFRHTTSTYNTMIYIAGETKKFQVVEELIVEMDKNKCKKDIKTWTILISHYGNSNSIAKVLLLFENMKNSGFNADFSVYKAMIRTLCNNKKPDIAMEFYNEMVSKEIEPDTSLYKVLLLCLARSGNLDAIQLIAKNMINISQIPEQDVYTYMLKSFCISGRIKESLEVIRDMKNNNIAIDNKQFEILVKGMCRADRINDALEIVDILKQKDVLDEKIYGLIINGYLRKNDILNALQVFDVLQDHVKIVKIPISTYTELMQHLFRRNEFEKAFDIYKTMLESGLELDIVAVTALVAGFVQDNRVSEAWTVIKSMEKKGINANKKFYMVFIKELHKISKTDEINNVLDHMKASNLVTQDDITSHFGKKQESENTQQLDQIKKSQETFRYLAVSEKTNPTKSFSDHDLREIIKHDLDFPLELVVEILKNRRLDGGATWRFFSWVGTKPGFRHTTETYNMAIKIAGQAKDFKRMRLLFNEMKRNGIIISTNTWTIMIMQYGRIGLTKIASKIFHEMTESGCKPNGSTYKYLIVSFCGKKGRMVNDAMKAFSEMVQDGFLPDKELLEIYLLCLSEVGNFLEIKKCVERLVLLGFSTPLSYSLCIRALFRAGEVDEGLRMANELGGNDENTLARYIYGSLIHALLRKRRLNDALTKIESMKRVGIFPTIHVYTSLLVYFFKEKRVSEGLEVFYKMKRNGCEPTVVTYSSLVRGLVTNGKISDAFSVFRKMKSEGPVPDFKTYSMFIFCLCKEGESEEAMKVLSEMLAVGIAPSTVNFRDVFYGLNREGKRDLAQSVLKRKWDVISRRKCLIN